MTYKELYNDYYDNPLVSGSFRELQVYSFLRVYSNIKFSEEQDIRKIFEDVLPDSLKSVMLCLFMNILEHENKEDYEKLCGENGFSDEDFWHYITENYFKDGKKVLNYIGYTLERELEEIFPHRNLFNEYIDSDKIKFLMNKYDITKRNAEVLVFLMLDERKDFLNTKKATHSLFCFSQLVDKKPDDVTKDFIDATIALKKKKLLDNDGLVISEIRSFLFYENTRLLKKIDFKENFADIYSLEKIMDANKNDIGIIKSFIQHRNKGFIISVNFENKDDGKRILRVIDKICKDIGQDFYGLKDSSNVHEVEKVLECVASVNGILYLDSDEAKNFSSRKDFPCPIFTTSTPFEYQLDDSNDDDDEKFDIFKYLNDFDESKKEFTDIGKIASYIWNFKLPAHNEYEENCRNYLLSAGNTLKDSHYVATYCHETKISFSEWERISNIMKSYPEFSEEKIKQIIDSFNTRIPHTKEDKNGHYEISVLNTSVSTDEILEEIVNVSKWKEQGDECDGSYKALFYGISGGGKTAFAKKIAEKLNKNVIKLAPSDYARKYHGQSERIIKAVFKSAKETDSIILLDECDSILWNRNNVNASWEVGIINEMLQQIEDFNGILFATTNLRMKIDPAMDRRFTAKVEFFGMKREGIRTLCDSYFGKFSLTDHDVDEIAYSGEVCPGDFHVVWSRVRLKNPDALNRETIRDMMIDVVRGKNMEKSSKIGFAR